MYLVGLPEDDSIVSHTIHSQGSLSWRGLAEAEDLAPPLAVSASEASAEASEP